MVFQPISNYSINKSHKQAYCESFKLLPFLPSLSILAEKKAADNLEDIPRN